LNFTEHFAANLLSALSALDFPPEEEYDARDSNRVDFSSFALLSATMEFKEQEGKGYECHHQG
jgi:hypothetical protein